MADDIINMLIVGSGPAGCTAAIYGARANLSPVLIEGSQPGGQLTTTPEIGNWPGAFANPSGYDLMETLKKHATMLGTKFLSDRVVSASLAGEVKELTLGSGEVLRARTVVIATGASARYLGLEGERTYMGHGVSACATCDGFFFRKKEVAVVGGGAAAFTEAIFLASLCSKVYLIHRRDGFRAEAVQVDRLRALEQEGKAEFVLNARVTDLRGDGTKLTSVVVEQGGKEREIPLAGVFMAIGHVPQTEVFKGGIETDAEGYIVVGKGRATATSVPGVFAAGDCADRTYRQAITSAGSGCQAALDVEHYLNG